MKGRPIGPWPLFIEMLKDKVYKHLIHTYTPKKVKKKLTVIFEQHVVVV